MAVAQSGLPVEIEPFELVTTGAAWGMDGVVYLLVAPTHRERGLLFRLRDGSEKIER